MGVEELAEALGFAEVVAENGDLVSVGKFGELGDGFFGFGLEAHEGADGEADGGGVSGAQQAYGALLELTELEARERRGIFQDRGEGINAFYFGEPIEIALGLLGDFEGSPENDDRFRMKVGEQVRGVGGVGKLALEIEDLDGFDGL